MHVEGKMFFRASLGSSSLPYLSVTLTSFLNVLGAFIFLSSI